MHFAKIYHWNDVFCETFLWGSLPDNTQRGLKGRELRGPCLSHKPMIVINYRVRRYWVYVHSLARFPEVVPQQQKSKQHTTKTSMKIVWKKGKILPFFKEKLHHSWVNLYIFYHFCHLFTILKNKNVKKLLLHPPKNGIKTTFVNSILPERESAPTFNAF